MDRNRQKHRETDKKKMKWAETYGNRQKQTEMDKKKSEKDRH